MPLIRCVGRYRDLNLVLLAYCHCHEGRTMNRLSRCLATFAVVAIAGIAPAQEKKEAPIVEPLKGVSKTIELFDGKTLDGWEGYEDLWSVKDGAIVGKNTKPLKFSTYLLTK